ncbi:MAG: AmmeMemoRadiSam system protein B [Candidatus Kapaibacteriota bacterium]
MLEGKIPTLRKDLDLSLIKQENEEFVLLIDRKKIAETPIAITKDFLTFLLFLDSQFTVDSLKEYLKKEFNFENIDNLLSQIEELDNYGFMESPSFEEKLKANIEQYRKQPFRPMITANRSFPDDAPDFLLFMDELFTKAQSQNEIKNFDGIIVPHLDLSLKNYSHRVYAAGYNAIRESEPDLVVIFGTSHFVSSDYFMLSRKNYETPLGPIEIAQEIIDDLQKELKDDLTIDEEAHRYEHSTEYPAVILQYLFKGQTKILPILVGSFYDCMVNKTLPSEQEKINKFIRTLQKVLKDSNKKVVYLASVDFSHIGMKFGNEFDALEKLEECKKEDFESIKLIENLDVDGFFKKNAETLNKWNICGLFPIYAFMKTMEPRFGKFLDYNQWYEKETQSAVTFASLGFKV